MGIPATLRVWLSAIQARRTRPSYSVLCDATGVTQHSVSAAGEHSIRFAWEQITAVYAFKRDCFAYDQIRLILGNESEEKWIEISEEDSGYQQLVRLQPQFLPACLAEDASWQPVAFPAFETNWTQLSAKEAKAD